MSSRKKWKISLNIYVFQQYHFAFLFLALNATQTIEHQTAAKYNERKKKFKREKVSDDVSNDFDNIADKSSVSMLFYTVIFASLIFCQTINYQMFSFFLLFFAGVVWGARKIFGANNLCAF